MQACFVVALESGCAQAGIARQKGLQPWRPSPLLVRERQSVGVPPFQLRADARPSCGAPARSAIDVFAATVLGLKVMRLASMQAVQAAVKGLRTGRSSPPESKDEPSAAPPRGVDDGHPGRSTQRRSSGLGDRSWLEAFRPEAEQRPGAAASVVPLSGHLVFASGSPRVAHSSRSHQPSVEESNRWSAATLPRGKKILRARRLRWWSSKPAQALMAASAFVCWGALALAFEVLVATPATQLPGAQVCALPIEYPAVVVWPATVCLIGAVAWQLWSLRRINESSHLRLELWLQAAGCLLCATALSLAAARPEVLSVVAASDLCLAIGASLGIGWPLALSFSGRFRLANEQIDQLRVERLVAFGAGAAGDTGAVRDADKTSAAAKALGWAKSSRKPSDTSLERLLAVVNESTPATLAQVLLAEQDVSDSWLHLDADAIVHLLHLEAHARLEVQAAKRELEVARFSHPGKGRFTLPPHMKHGSMGFGFVSDAASLNCSRQATARVVKVAGAVGRQPADKRRRPSPADPDSENPTEDHEGSESNVSRRQLIDVSQATEALAVALPTTPKDLGMQACLAHSEAFERFSHFVESELASENLLFLEAVFRFRVKLAALLLHAGLWHDFESPLRPLRFADRPAVRALVRKLVDERVAAEPDALEELAWLVSVTSSRAGWQEVIRLRPPRASAAIHTIETTSGDVPEFPQAKPEVLHRGSTPRMSPVSRSASRKIVDEAAAAVGGLPRQFGLHSPIRQGAASPLPPVALVLSADAASLEPAEGVLEGGPGASSRGLERTEPACESGRAASFGKLPSAISNYAHGPVLPVAEVERSIAAGIATIADNFVRPGSILEVNVSSATRLRCLRAVELSSIGLGLQTFDLVATHVRKTISRDAFPRFLASPATAAWFASRLATSDAKD